MCMSEMGIVGIPTLSCLFQMPLKVTVLLLAVVCAWCVEECVCFPNGSVAFSCGNMMPVHPPFTPSTRSPPFTLSASSATYRPGGLISGTCAATFLSTLYHPTSLLLTLWLPPSAPLVPPDPTCHPRGCYCATVQRSKVMFIGTCNLQHQIF